VQHSALCKPKGAARRQQSHCQISTPELPTDGPIADELSEPALHVEAGLCCTHDVCFRFYTKSHASIEAEMEGWVNRLDESLDTAPLVRWVLLVVDKHVHHGSRAGHLGR